MVNLYNKNLNNYARDNRKARNLSEALLWNELKQKKQGVDFTKQKPIGNYIADFYCKELKLVIEIDGATHKYKEEYDTERDKYMNEIGLKVLRIDDIDVKRNMTRVLERIRYAINKGDTK
ncbi:MAG: endonuclease domain-containing protein [Rickettsiales bacterium]|jgi:very-short-patch-repair endonuclease|nr:endonuclease domain-containing protein [Rickettsiales bacterium]